MIFNKIKNIFQEHSQLPTVEDRNEFLRIYYSFRIKNRSFINYFEILKKNFKIKYINKKPVLSPGLEGCFDDAGVMPSFVYNKKLYYTGWHLSQSVPYSQSIGLAVFDEAKNKFVRTSNGPILDKNELSPYLLNSPVVHKNKMFFCNGTGWFKNCPTYNIWMAKKINKKWIVEKHLFGNKSQIYSRPFYTKDGFLLSKKKINKKYEIFIYKNKKFIKIIPKSRESGAWDCEMTCYPYLYDKYVFYNGNNFGSTGIGVAERIC